MKKLSIALIIINLFIAFLIAGYFPIYKRYQYQQIINSLEKYEIQSLIGEITIEKPHSLFQPKIQLNPTSDDLFVSIFDNQSIVYVPPLSRAYIKIDNYGSYSIEANTKLNFGYNSSEVQLSIQPLWGVYHFVPEDVMLSEEEEKPLLFHIIQVNAPIPIVAANPFPIFVLSQFEAAKISGKMEILDLHFYNIKEITRELSEDYPFLYRAIAAFDIDEPPKTQNLSIELIYNNGVHSWYQGEIELERKYPDEDWTIEELQQSHRVVGPLIRFKPSVEEMRTSGDQGLAERQMVNEIYNTYTRTQLWEGRFIQPCQPRPGKGISRYGIMRTYEAADGSYSYSRHRGLDIGNYTGTPVRASNTGKIVLAEFLTRRGGTIIIDHGHGLHTGYIHLSKIVVNKGDMVQKGDIIAEVGSTGLSTGPHLHFEASIGPWKIDPFALMEADFSWYPDYLK